MHLGKNKILITGVNGFLGNELYKFLSKNNTIIGTSRKKIKPFIKINYPTDNINDNIFENIHTVIHLASLDRDQVNEDINLSKKINIEFAEDLIEKCIKKKVKNFIYFSSIGVYGHNLKNKVTENINPSPKDFYSKLKYSTEKKILKKKNIRVIILRVSNIIGAPSKITRGFLKLFLPDICLSALKNKSIILKSDGNQYRDFLDLKTLLKVISKLLKLTNKLKKNMIFNVSSGRSSQIFSISKKVKKIMKNRYKVHISIVKGKKFKEKKYQINNLKLKNFLKINLNHDLDKTILNVIKFLKINGNRLS